MSWPAARMDEPVRFDTLPIRRRVLSALQRSLHYSGLASLYPRLWRPEGFLALMYHSVADSARAPYLAPGSAIPADIFERQLRLLRRTCNVISLAAAVDCQLSGREPPANAVVITFDDGYLDNFDVAAPLLAKYGLPATLFVCTGYVARREPQWIDELHTAFRFRQVQRLELPTRPVAFSLESPKGERDAYEVVSAELLSLDYITRRRVLDEVKAQLRPSTEPPPLTLGWDDLRAMRREYPGFEFGLHTHDHVDLSRMSVAAAVAEIAKSQQVFRAEMGYAARYLTYPYGRLLRPLVDRLPGVGVDAAFVTQPTERVTRETDMLVMPRYEVAQSLVDLRMWSGGALPGLGKKLFGRVLDRI